MYIHAHHRPGIVAVVCRECVRMGSSAVYPLVLLILPLASFVLLWAIFAAAVPRDLPVAILDADHSPLSRQAARMIDATSSLRVAEVVRDEQEGELLIREGRVYALVVFPVDWERDATRGAAPRATCFTNAQFLLPASLVRRDLRATFSTLSAGLEVRLREARGEQHAAALAHIEPIFVERHTLFNPELSYLTYLLSALLPTVLQIFVLVGAVWAFGSELRDGTAGKWLDAAGGSIWRGALGKILPQTAVFAGLSGAMLALLFDAAGIPFSGSRPVVVLGTLLFVLAVQALGIFLVGMFANMRFALSAAAFISGPAFAFSGLTFPVAAMPLAARLWGGMIPLTHYIELLIAQAIRGADPVVSRPTLFALAAFVVMLPLVALPRLARLARDTRTWGRS